VPTAPLSSRITDMGRSWLYPGCALLLAAGSPAAIADPAPVTMNGVPAQVIPSIPEVGAPTFVTPAGGGSFMGDGGGPTGTDGSASSTDWTGYSGGGTAAMDAMMATPYGALASQAATQLGLNPEAMAGLGIRGVALIGNPRHQVELHGVLHALSIGGPDANGTGFVTPNFP